MTASDLKKVIVFSVTGAIIGLLVAAVALALLIPGFSLADLVEQFFSWMFGFDGTHVTWFITRAAGLVAYLLLWLSTAWGLAVASKIFDDLFHRAFTYDMHQFISLLAIGFTALHLIVLFFDQYQPFSMIDVLVPFVAPYRPIWVGMGVIGLYLTLLVTITFYIRTWIGQKAFRAIHLASFAAYAGVTIHGLMAGTDSPLLFTQLIYAGTALSIVFLSVYWFIMLPRNRAKSAPQIVPPPQPAFRRN